jgi:hypothetical protein
MLLECVDANYKDDMDVADSGGNRYIFHVNEYKKKVYLMDYVKPLEGEYMADRRMFKFRFREYFSLKTDFFGIDSTASFDIDRISGKGSYISKPNNISITEFFKSGLVKKKTKQLNCSKVTEKF